MEEFFTNDYAGTPFILFDAAHIAALLVITLTGILFVRFGRKWDEKNRRRFRYAIGAIMIATEVSWHAWAIYYDSWTIQTMLPFHLCSISLWLTIYLLFSKNYFSYELVYFLGIGGAMQALITPNFAQYGFPHFRAFQTFIAHGLLVLVPIYMTLVEGFRPTLQSVRRVIVWSSLYMIPVFILNQLIGSNYLFIAHKLAEPTILDLLADWPWYIFQMQAIGIVTIFLLYSPFLIKDLLAKPKVEATMT